MSNLKMSLYRAAGYVYVPEHIKSHNEEKILHISDTPRCFFKALKNILKHIEPEYIIHTGDLVDDVKLGLYPRSKSIYERNVKQLMKIMESSKARGIFIALGNHDDYEVVKKHSKRSVVLDGVSNIEIHNIKLRISHYYSLIEESPSRYNLFGHNLDMTNRIEEHHIFLNGIESINVIAIQSGKIFQLFYPYGIDDTRKGMGKVGL